ncbi:MAG: hypothetical protein ACRDQA_11450 [Nocardioidaceae bacterium]
MRRPVYSKPRLTAELLLPGSLVGVVAAIAVAGLALLAGLSVAYAVVAALALGVPLSLFGAGYNFLLARGHVRLGGITPAVGYWLVGYVVSRVIHAVTLDIFLGQPIGLGEGVVPFLVFQALVAVGFAVGFVWLHEHAAPLWWLRIRDHNPVAASYVAAYTQQAAHMQQKKDTQKARRKGGETEQRPASLKRTRRRPG